MTAPDPERRRRAALAEYAHDVQLAPAARTALWQRIEDSLDDNPEAKLPSDFGEVHSPHHSTRTRRVRPSAVAGGLALAVVVVLWSAGPLRLATADDQPQPMLASDRAPVPRSEPLESSLRRPIEVSPRGPKLEPPAISAARHAGTDEHRRGQRFRAKPRSDLRAELELLRRARSALDDGNFARARDLLDEHATRFPHGQLGYDRDVLRVAAWCRSGASNRGRLLLGRLLSTRPEAPELERLADLCHRSEGTDVGSRDQ